MEPGNVLRNAAVLRRYENRIKDAITQRIAEGRDALEALLLARPLDGVSAGRQAARLASVAKEADKVMAKMYADIATLSKGEFIGLAQAQAGFSAKALASAAKADLSLLGVPTRAQLQAIVTRDPTQGLTVRDWWGKQARDTRTAFRSQVQLGMTRGESNAEIIKRITGDRVGGGYTGGVAGIAASSAERLVRTATTDIANAAAFETYRANDDLTQEYEYVATLDDRTTEICIGLDGQRFRYDDPAAPKPPQHWNCRSTIIPVVNLKGAGATSAKAAPERQNYGDWLRTLTTERQNDILGKDNADLFRAGRTLADIFGQMRGTATVAEFVPEAIDLTGKGTRERMLKHVEEVEKRSSDAEKANAARLSKLEALRADELRLRSKLVEDYDKGLLPEGEFTSLRRASVERSQALMQETLRLSAEANARRELTAESLREKFVYQDTASSYEVRTNVRGATEKGIVEEGATAFRRMIGDKLSWDDDATEVMRLSGDDRSFYMPKVYRTHPRATGLEARRGGNVLLYFGDGEEVSTLVHELAHSLEDRNPDLLRKVCAWRDKRIAASSPENRKIVRLRDALHDPRYRLNEIAAKDDFKSWYMGKIYRNASGVDVADEVLSMGMEWMFKNPLEMARQDPAYFDFILDVLRGFA